MLHHTMEPGMDQAIYVGMAAPIRKTYTVLMDEKTMAQEIDRVIVEAVRSKLPVYIYVPMDVTGSLLDAKRLTTPLDTAILNSKGMEDEIVSSILELIKKSSAPAILADVLAIRHGGKELVGKLMNLTKFPTYSTPLSKGVVDETSPYFNGLYNGSGKFTSNLRIHRVKLTKYPVSFDGVAEAIEISDLVLDIGPLHSDSNTGGFTRNITNNHTILLGHNYCQIHDKKDEGIHFWPVLKRIVEEIKKQPAQYQKQSWSKLEVSCPWIDVSILLTNGSLHF